MRSWIGIALLLAGCASRQGPELEWPRHHALLAAESETANVADAQDARPEPEGRNEVILFTGYTTERGDGGFTVGLTYKRQINDWLGVVAFGEAILQHEPAYVFGLGPAFVPVENLTLVSLIGVELEHGESGEGLVRLGGSYRISGLWGAEVKPGVFVDLFRGHAAFVIGLEFGWDF